MLLRLASKMCRWAIKRRCIQINLPKQWTHTHTHAHTEEYINKIRLIFKQERACCAKRASRRCWRVTNWVANNCALRRVMREVCGGALRRHRQKAEFSFRFLRRFSHAAAVPANVWICMCKAYKMASRVYFKTRTPLKVHTNNHTYLHIYMHAHFT